MLDRLDTVSLEIVRIGRETAKEWKHDFLGTEHLLVGILEHHENMAADVLLRLGVGQEALTLEVLRDIGRGPEGAEIDLEAIKFTPRLEKVLDGASREALTRSHKARPEHLLLGIARVEDGVASRILETSFDIDPHKLREETLRAIEEYKRDLESYVVLVKRKSSDTEPSIPLYHAKVEKPDKAPWEQTFGSLELLNAWLEGVKTALVLEGYAAHSLEWRIPPTWGEPSGLRWRINKEDIHSVEELNAEGAVIQH